MATKQALIDSLDAFTRSYLETALWASTECDAHGDMGAPLDENYSIDDFTVEALRESIDDCKSVQECEVEALEEAYGHGPSYGPEQAGHDFWLTRNGHGAGFWDCLLGDTGERLTRASKPYGSVDLMVYRGKVCI